MSSLQEYTVIVVIRGDCVLLQYKLRGPYINVWNFPGGKLENIDRNAANRAESYRKGACRELLEETGLSCGISNIINVMDIHYHRPEGKAILAVLAVEVDANWDFTIPGTTISTYNLNEDEPLAWVPILNVKKLPTAGDNNVWHLLQESLVCLEARK